VTARTITRRMAALRRPVTLAAAAALALPAAAAADTSVSISDCSYAPAAVRILT
jgi:hypothetical protein